MTRQFKLFLLTGLLACLISQTGCSKFFAMFKKKPSAYELRKKKRAELAKKNEATYQTLAAQKSCDGIEKAYNAIYRTAAKSKERRTKTALHLAKCNKWDLIFRRLTISHQGWVNHMMDKLVAAKMPVHKAYNTWLASSKRPYGSNASWYGFTYTRNWLAKAKNPKQHCKVMWDHHERVSKPLYPQLRRRIRSMMIGYLHMANCRDYHDKIVGLLTHNVWQVRNQACAFLKDWGKTPDLKKLAVIARTDSYSYINRRVRIYPVRDTCRSAIGRVKMRN